MNHSRRHFLSQQAFGLSGVALAYLLKQDGVSAAPAKPTLERPTYDLLPKRPKQEPQARAMISMFMQGGPSHIDLFDPKPELQKRHLQSFTGDIKYDNAAEASAKLFASPWKFARHGECGMDLSELLPGLAGVADDICLIRSMHTGVNNHGQSINALNTGRVTPGRPALGSWMTYGLGSESQNLPAFVVLTDPTGLPVLGVENWQNGWLPSLYQGTVVRPQEPRILNLDPPAHLKGPAQDRFLSYLGQINREHLDRHAGELDLAARIQSYELAARMQVAAKEALDLTQESEAVHKLYGLDDPLTRDYGSRCLIARRLVERGVRFVQIHTGNQTWDHHGNIEKGLPAVCKKVDRPGAALVADLKARGMLDTTLVHWGGEMGRLPVIQNEKNIGRDHNTYGFSMWLAGGGIKRGCVYGATDEFGHKAVENVVNHYDYHATLLHLFGLGPEQLTFERPTGVGSLIDGQQTRVVWDILERGQPA
ncbi:DUF1501 domain-containing protein [Planctellipticum variicoloris]|uniref:DUF1501 domain-containing protein n=1 Tax=Planctellipticum variicoloris TaxID=3064265 RepID=UPI003013581A|nr:DUF1501 domain-containing protein [Planctomycetaceae bacterium SH412]